MPLFLAIHDYDIGLDAPIGRFSDRAVAQSLVGLYPFREIHGVPACPHYKSLLILSAGNVFEIRHLAMSAVAILVRDLVVWGAVAQKCRGDHAMNGAFSLETAHGQGDVESPVLHLDGLQDLAGLSIADLPLV